MIFLLEKSVNFDFRTVHAPRRTRTDRDRTEAPGLSRFAHPAVHWPRAAASRPLHCHRELPGAALCRLSPTPPRCEGRLGGLEEPFFVEKLHQGNGLFSLYQFERSSKNSLIITRFAFKWQTELVQNESRLKKLFFLQELVTSDVKFVRDMQI